MIVGSISNPIISSLTLTKPLFPKPPKHRARLSPLTLTTKTTSSRRRRLAVAASAEKNDEKEAIKEGGDGDESDGGGEAGKGGWRLLEGIRWGDLVVSSDPDNIVAVGLTGLLTWASVQVLWQLIVISLAILVAAIRYSFIAALLIFILITLL